MLSAANLSSRNSAEHLDYHSQPREQRTTALRALLKQHAAVLEGLHNVQLENMTIAWMREMACQQRESASSDGGTGACSGGGAKHGGGGGGDEKTRDEDCGHGKSSRQRRWSEEYWGPNARVANDFEQELAEELKQSMRLDDLLVETSDADERIAAVHRLCGGGGGDGAAAGSSSSGSSGDSSGGSCGGGDDDSGGVDSGTDSQGDTPPRAQFSSSSTSSDSGDSGLGKQMLDLEILRRCVAGLERRLLATLAGPGLPEADRVYQVCSIELSVICFVLVKFACSSQLLCCLRIYPPHMNHRTNRHSHSGKFLALSSSSHTSGL